jgi:hypothetical protein
MGSFFMIKNQLSNQFDAYANDPHHDDYVREEVDKYSCGHLRKDGWKNCPLCSKEIDVKNTLKQLKENYDLQRKTNGSNGRTQA